MTGDAQRALEQLEEMKTAKVTRNWRYNEAINMAICHFRKLAEDEKKTIFSINFNVVVLDEDIDDIMCSALEGGINYWCDMVDVDGEYLGEYASEQISKDGVLILHDAEEDREYILTRGNFLMGLEAYLKRQNTCDFVECVNHELRINTSYIDASMADSIIQYAIFGEEVYG